MCFLVHSDMSKKPSTLPRTKSIPETFCISYDFTSCAVIHKPASQTHISITIPDPNEFPVFIGVFRWFTFMLVEESRSTGIALPKELEWYSMMRVLYEGVRTVWASTPLRISSSRLCLLALSLSSSSSGSGAFAALRFLPETSSASRCCRSAGVSVQSELSTFLAGATERANCRAFSFVGSSAGSIVRLVWEAEAIIDSQPNKSELEGGTSIHSSRLSVFGFAAS